MNPNKATLMLAALALLVAGPTYAQPPPITGAIMVTSGEVSDCTYGNIDASYVVIVTALTAKGVVRARRFFPGSGNSFCVIQPLTGWVGTQVQITGVLQDTLAIPGFAPGDAPVIAESCFNVEAFTVGLAAAGAEFDPQDPANIIDAEGYGLAWYDSDTSLKPGPSYYTVTGCAGNCPTNPAIYNTDDNFAVGCQVLNPIR